MEHSKTPPIDDPGAELHVCRAQLDLLLTHAPLATWITDRGLRFTHAAGAALTRAGVAPQALTGEHLSRLLDEYTPGAAWTARLRDAHQRALRGLTTSLTVVWQGHTYQVRVEPLRDAGGEIGGCIGLAVETQIEAQAQTEAERALEAERARLAAIINHAPEGIVVADAEGQIVLTNPAADRLYNHPVPRNQPYESHAELQIVHPDGTPYDPRDLPLTRAALDGETTEEAEMAILWPGGQRRELLVNAAPIHSPGEGLLGAVGIFQDVTDRKQTAERVQRYVDRLRVLHEMDRRILSVQAAPEMARAVLEQLPQLVPCVHASAVLCDLTRHEMTLLAMYTGVESAPVGATAPGDWRGPISPAWEEVFRRLAGGEAYVIPDLQAETAAPPRVEQLRAQGVRAHVYIPLQVQDRLIGSLDVGLPIPAPVPAEQMDILREMADQFAVGIQQAQLHAEIERYTQELERMVRRRTRALEVSEARFRAVFEEAGLGIVLLNRRGRVITGNPALQRTLGCSDKELHGRPLAELLHPDEASEAARRLEQLIEGKLPAYHTECRFPRADGTTVEASVTFSRVRPAQSRSQLVMALVEDITERKHTQQALIASERLAITGRLAASLAHEIGNPLQSVIGCLELAHEVSADGEDPGEYLEVAMGELDRATRILNQMRNLNRRSDGEREPADVNDLLDKMLLVSRKQCQNQHVIVTRQPAANLPALPVIPDQIQSVFLNLVINALDAMPNGGELRIEAKPTEAPRGVAVTFADTGMGIPAVELPHLFEPFHTTKDKGLGLGLYISRRIVRDHGGEIQVQSQEGEGATFTVWLPA